MTEEIMEQKKRKRASMGGFNIPEQPIPEMEQGELLLTDEVIENTLEEYAKILEVEFNPLVYYVIGDLLDRLLAKAKQHYEQKGLDRPELREKIAISLPSLWCDACPHLDGCEMKDVMNKACNWQLDYADQILALIKGEK